MDNDDQKPHYDTVASAFLGVSSTMMAIIGSLLPFLKIQKALSNAQSFLFVSVIVFLITTIVASTLSLMERNDTRFKRVLCKISAIPLIISTVILVVIILI
ncbi:MAG: hypothetical protein ABSB28_05360 [Candidatus Bathyarchaeia archaeon]